MYFSLKSIQLIYKRHEKKRKIIRIITLQQRSKKIKGRRRERKRKKKRGRGRKPYPTTDPTTCTRGQATTAASAIDSASRIFRWREAAIIHERCHYARKPYTIASVATLRATDYTPHWKKSKLSAPRSSSSNRRRQRSFGKKTSLEPCPRMKKSQTIDRFFFLLPLYISRFIFSTVKSFNPKSKEFKFYYSGRNVKRFWRKKERKDFLILNEKHRKLTSRPSDQGVARWFLVLLFNVLRSSRSHFL